MHKRSTPKAPTAECILLYSLKRIDESCQCHQYKQCDAVESFEIFIVDNNAVEAVRIAHKQSSNNAQPNHNASYQSSVNNRRVARKQCDQA